MNVLEQVTALEHEAENFVFRWENPHQIIEQIQSECLEIQANLNEATEQENHAKLQEEISDLLHAAFSLCVFCQFDPKETLEKAVNKFGRRLQAVKEIANVQGLTNLKGYTFDELMKIWEQAKEQVG